jgi:hypothetical protein
MTMPPMMYEWLDDDSSDEMMTKRMMMLWKPGLTKPLALCGRSIRRKANLSGQSEYNLSESSWLVLMIGSPNNF